MSAKARAAAEDLKSAIDRHLAACEARTGEADPAVQQAYDALRVAAQHYDDALFEDYDEVTPFEFADPEADDEGADPDELPETLTVLLRRDYDVVDPDALMTAARAAAADDYESADEDAEETVGDLVYALLQTHGVEGLATSADELGLEPVGGTLWVVDQVDGDLDDEPFDGVHERWLRVRIDEVYDV